MKEEIVTNEKIYYQFLACLSRKGGEGRQDYGKEWQCKKIIIMLVFYTKKESKA